MSWMNWANSRLSALGGLSGIIRRRITPFRVNFRSTPTFGTLYPIYENRLREYLEAAWDGFHPVLDFRYMGTSTTGEIEEEPIMREPDQRERLLQFLRACPAGSNGRAVEWWLRKVEPLVGSFAAAHIDEFFAAEIERLVRPWSREDIDYLAKAETAYWAKQEGLDYFAGQLLNETVRKLLQNFSGWWLTVGEQLFNGPKRPEDV